MNTHRFRKILLLISIPVLYALFVRFLFGIDTWQDLFSVMSITFLFCLPTIVGALTVYLSDRKYVQKFAYRFFIPWIPVLIFFVLTLTLAIEGWACWLMVLPVFLLAASIGGLIGGYFKLRKKENKFYFSILLVLPFLLSPVEQMIGAIPATYEAYTCIDIKSTPEKIWQHVTRVNEIPEAQDKGWLTNSLGFPRPLRAELNYNGVGAYREAIFTNGLIFHETVTEYEEGKKMVFSIKAFPHEIPSATLDEHVVIGGRYFDVLNGTYELEKRTNDTYRLHLYSKFQLHTTFNLYAGLWAKWIMKDIQNNILQIQKFRAEQE